ncbi:hypothetical protein NIES4106_59290 (plasmid) [Fischerella sp. NIES-4106]|nr:hypothetical protein NIES4106_59290 [Fischerella sp. NIES-4106]
MQASTSNQGMFWEEAPELFEEIVGWLDSDSITMANTSNTMII